MNGEIDKKPILQESIDIWDDHIAASRCRDEVVKGFFKFQLRNAIYFGRKAEQNRRLFWESIRNIYPEFRDKPLRIDTEEMVVYIREEDEQNNNMPSGGV